MDCGGNAEEVGGDVVFESVFADVAQKFLQAQVFHQPRATEGVQWIVGEAAAARVTANGAVEQIDGQRDASWSKHKESLEPRSAPFRNHRDK